MRKIKWIILTLLLAAAGWVTWKWLSVEAISADALALIPSDAIYCISTENPIESWKEITGSQAWSHLRHNTYFASLSASVNNLDSLIRENDLLFDLIGERALVVSAHMAGPKEYDFLFLVDLKEVAGIKFINDYLGDFTTAGVSVSKEKYGDDDILILHDPSDDSDLYLSLPGTYLVASYTKKIVQSSLDAKNAEQLNAGPAFIETAEDVASGGVLQLYLNYEMLPRFMTCYSDGANEYIERLSRALRTSALTLSLEDGLVRATGHSYVNDSVESYIKTLLVSGKAGSEFMEIAPQRTAFCVSLGVGSFSEFFSNFQKNLQEDVGEYESYRRNLKRVEDYLKIDLQKNFIDWIGEEVALLEMQSSGGGHDNEVALILKADNIEKARNNLAYVEKMVRKKTPVKFKTVDHHGYSISYLSVKGLFGILLGKFFARYDKPYYTIINNFIVFSDHPQTLKSIIDDYLAKKTMIRSAETKAFRREFDDEGSVFVYMNTPILFNTMKKLADRETKVSMDRNKEYIVCFQQVGFQLVPEKDRFNARLVGQFIAPDLPVRALQPERSVLRAEVSGGEREEVKPEPAVHVEEEGGDPMELPYIYVQNLNASSYTSSFPDSTTHYTVELKNGFKNGSFTEYYPSGEVKMTGRFRNDKRDGTWRLYDETGEQIIRRTYDEGTIRKERK